MEKNIGDFSERGPLFFFPSQAISRRRRRTDPKKSTFKTFSIKASDAWEKKQRCLNAADATFFPTPLFGVVRNLAMPPEYANSLLPSFPSFYAEFVSSGCSPLPRKAGGEAGGSFGPSLLLQSQRDRKL